MTSLCGVAVIVADVFPPSTPLIVCCDSSPRAKDTVSLKATDMSLLQWINIANAGMFSVINENGSTRFGGFRPAVRRDSKTQQYRGRDPRDSQIVFPICQDKETISKFCKEHLAEVDFQEVPVCGTGLNWGTVEVGGKMLNFKATGQPKAQLEGHHTMDINLSNVEKVTMNKNDILLEFHQDDTDIGKEVSPACLTLLSSFSLCCGTIFYADFGL